MAMKVASDDANTRAVPTKYASDKQLAQRFEVSRATIWRWCKKDFPKPVRLAGCATRWLLSEIEEYEKKAAAERAS